MAGAQVVIATPERASIATARTDAQGRFRIDAPAPGSYLLIVSARGFQDARQSLTIAASGMKPIDVSLLVVALEEDVTVTASPGLVQDIRTLGQAVNIIDREKIDERVKTVVAQAVERKPAWLQQTSPTMAGVFVRGLTGNKVNVFVDGVRYSNGAQRGGVNTFLDLIDRPPSIGSRCSGVRRARNMAATRWAAAFSS